MRSVSGEICAAVGFAYVPAMVLGELAQVG